MSPDGIITSFAPRVTVGLTERCKEGGPVRGTCWVCTRNGVWVIWLGPIQLPAHTAPLYGCEPCTQRLHDWASSHEGTIREHR